MPLGLITDICGSRACDLGSHTGAHTQKGPELGLIREIQWDKGSMPVNGGDTCHRCVRHSLLPHLLCIYQAPYPRVLAGSCRVEAQWALKQYKVSVVSLWLNSDGICSPTGHTFLFNNNFSVLLFCSTTTYINCRKKELKKIKTIKEASPILSNCTNQPLTLKMTWKERERLAKPHPFSFQFCLTCWEACSRQYWQECVCKRSETKTRRISFILARMKHTHTHSSYKMQIVWFQGFCLWVKCSYVL